MDKTLPYDEWVAAQRELKAIRQRVHMANLLDVEPLILRAHRSLTIDCQPRVAAVELKWAAGQITRYPWLRKSIEKFSDEMYRYSSASALPSLQRTS